jgi:tellurite resistance protein TerC
MATLIWAAFVAGILALLALDLGVFNRRPHEISITEALGWTGFWVGLALAFNVLVFWLYENNWIGVGLAFPEDVDGRTAAIEFFTGYVLEKTLSLDNIFVIALIFSHFRVPLAFQHRVLFWGVVGALVLRGVMIGAGALLLHRFAWMTYVFGGLLILTAVRMLIVRHDNLAPEENLAVRAARRLFRITHAYDGARFFTRVNGVRVATPLLLVLLMVESTDVMFAIDSIPAIFAVTDDPFIVYTSNVFAILGLRSLYFALAPMLARFRYLKTSLVFVLAYIGVKMMMAHSHPVPATVSLAIVGGIITVGLLASLTGGHRDTAPLEAPVAIRQLARTTVAVAWKAVILVVGGTTVALGLAMIVLPGPALLVIPLGLATLATQFLWARRLLDRVRREIHDGIAHVRADVRSVRDHRRTPRPSGQPVSESDEPELTEEHTCRP